MWKSDKEERERNIDVIFLYSTYQIHEKMYNVADLQNVQNFAPTGF